MNKAEFKGKTVLITGGTAGIGRSIALEFALHGANVAIFGTNEGRAKEVVVELNAAAVDPEQKFTYRLADISHSQEVERLINQLIVDFGKIDVLVNNAGITKDNLLVRMTEEDWDLVVDVNLKSIYNTCRVLIRPMIKARSGKIINISSVIGLTGNAGQVNYAASKSGMIGFTKSLAKEVASRGICVNCVAPGYIETQMTQVLPSQVKEAVLSKIPLSRIGQPSDIAYAVLFLASDRANYITGQILAVDGGMVM
jgi:3-oxoacyl-[acyl-carrier protein] reductase